MSTPQAAGEEGAECWTLERIQTQYRREGRSVIWYDHLPTMCEGHSAILLDPRHRMRAHLDVRFPGTRVTVIRPVDYPEGHPVPAHALPRFQGNPLDSYKVCGPIPEWLRGYWTAANQSPSWRGESTNDIFRQETRLRNIITGYAARAVRHMTTYEYRVSRGLNHGLAILYEEMSSYLMPPMLEDAGELLGDFMAMTEALSACRVQIRAHENQAAHARQEARNAAYLRGEEEARLK